MYDLARRIYPDIEAVYVDTGLELPEARVFALKTPNVTVLKDLSLNNITLTKSNKSTRKHKQSHEGQILLFVPNKKLAEPVHP